MALGLLESVSRHLFRVKEQSNRTGVPALIASRGGRFLHDSLKVPIQSAVAISVVAQLLPYNDSLMPPRPSLRRQSAPKELIAMLIVSMGGERANDKEETYCYPPMPDPCALHSTFFHRDCGMLHSDAHDSQTTTRHIAPSSLARHRPPQGHVTVSMSPALSVATLSVPEIGPEISPVMPCLPPRL